MKTWIPLAIAIILLGLGPRLRLLYMRRGTAPPPPPAVTDDPLQLPETSAIRAPLLPNDEPGALDSVTFSSDGKTIAGTNGTGLIEIYDAASGRLVVSFRAGGGGSLAGHPIAFSPDSKALAAPLPSGQFAVLDPADGRILRTMDGQPGISARNVRSAVAFSPDGKSLAGSYDTGEVVVWDVASGLRVGALSPHILPASGVPPASPRNPVYPARPAQVRVIVFSSDSKTLYALGDVARAWNPAATTGPRRLDLPAGLRCVPLAVSPDGATVAAIGVDRPVKPGLSILLIDAASGRTRVEIPSNQVIRGLAFLPGGRRLLFLEGDRDVRLWDVTTAKEITARRFERHFHVLHLAVSPDGRRIAAGGYESDAIFGVIGMIETDGTTLRPWRPAP